LLNDGYGNKRGGGGRGDMKQAQNLHEREYIESKAAAAIGLWAYS
jgi:hypothetical protein